MVQQMPRSFDVSIESDAQGADADLAAMNDEQRTEAIGRLERLRDRDIFGFEPLGWKRGPHGAWVLVSLGDWRYVCQWEEGMPNLWRLHIGRGELVVVRILHKDYVKGLVELATEWSEHG